MRSLIRWTLHKHEHDRATFYDMLQMPRARVLLDSLYHFADEVRLAGGYAVHDSAAFEKRYPGDSMVGVAESASWVPAFF
jgi:hypothetical protein